MKAYVPHLRLVGPDFEPCRGVCGGGLGFLFRSSLFYSAGRKLVLLWLIGSCAIGCRAIALVGILAKKFYCRRRTGVKKKKKEERDWGQRAVSFFFLI